MIRAIGPKVAVVILAVAAGAVSLAAPAGAIQTTTWGIQPADGSGPPRADLQYPSNGQTVHDAVIVYNRTAAAEVIHLSVLGASYRNGVFQYSKPEGGLAARIVLAGTDIRLGPHQQARVPVTVKMPDHSKTSAIAAISAEGSTARQGALLVRQQLVILVAATPTTSTPLVPRIGLWGPIAAVVLACAAVLVLREWRKRRRAGRSSPAPSPLVPAEVHG